MATDAEAKEQSDNLLEGLVGLSVVLLATFLGICNVKDNNIVQKMQLKQGERNNKWLWLQARNIRGTVYVTTAEQLSIPVSGESKEAMKTRQKLAAKYYEKEIDQEKKMVELEVEAKALDKEVNELGEMDDQFDLAEAALSIGLALMGVTVLLKRRWMFFLALVPSAFGTFMGIAGFMGMDTKDLGIQWMIDLLT